MVLHRAARVLRILPAVVCVCSALGVNAQAGEPGETWPEVSAFVPFGRQTRMYLDASYAKGKESEYATLDAAVYLDISLKPILRGNIKEEDWQRSRYLWVRIGYDRVSKVAEGAKETSEDRGIVSIYGKLEVPAQIWLEGRLRADLRWIGGDFSTRYRARLDATREFTVFGRTVVPYLNAEWFWDTRYGGVSRILWQAGPEVTVSKKFRYEIYLARQFDYHPNQSTLNALGFVAKWYF